MGPHPARSTLREHSLDGAMLYFHAETGTHVRVESPRTRELRRRAPRVVLFGITNACNLRCDFCSRDASHPSRWTLESAAELLEGLAEAGTLEVAFGGGEPFAFPELEALLQRLWRTTALALNITTNGTLFDDGVLARLAPMLGQVRLSIYEGQSWRVAAQRLSAARINWGANVLVDEAMVHRLPHLLVELAGLGARDVAILSYVGADSTRHLEGGAETLAAIIRASPIPARISVCFGSRLPVERLLDGLDDRGDCGAGNDFVTITPDKRMQSCSFQETSFEIASAADVVDVWRARREAHAEPSPRRGCARPSTSGRRRDLGGIRIWQSFSGNNSGECILVAKFEETADAKRLLEELLAGHTPAERYSSAWRELFTGANVDGPNLDEGEAPEEMLAFGRTFIARTYSAPGDNFPELRALAWQRGAEVIARGVHVHETPAILFVIAADASDRNAIVARAEIENATAIVYGEHVVGLVPRSDVDDCDAPLLDRAKTAIDRIAGGRSAAMELVIADVDAAILDGALSRFNASPPRIAPRLAAQFWTGPIRKDADAAASFAKGLDRPTTRVGSLLLVENLSRKKRVAIAAIRSGAGVSSLHGEELLIEAMFWRNPPPPTKGKKAVGLPPINAAWLELRVVERLRTTLGATPFRCTASDLHWGDRVETEVVTRAPGPALGSLEAFARAEGLVSHFGIREVAPIEDALRRLFADVKAIARERR